MTGILEALFAPPAPDDADVPCCMAAVNTDGRSCTCWEPIRLDLDDLHRVDVDQVVAELRDTPPTSRLCEGPPAIRPTMCGDCAYRPGSPERQRADGEQLDYSIRDRFYCHDGMPAVVAWWHPPTGTVTRVQDRAHYAPEIRADLAWRHDGRPGTLCAGWAASNQLPRPRRR